MRSSHIRHRKTSHTPFVNLVIYIQVQQCAEQSWQYDQGVSFEANWTTVGHKTKREKVCDEERSVSRNWGQHFPSVTLTRAMVSEETLAGAKQRHLPRCYLQTDMRTATCESVRCTRGEIQKRPEQELYANAMGVKRRNKTTSGPDG